MPIYLTKKIGWHNSQMNADQVIPIPQYVVLGMFVLAFGSIGWATMGGFFRKLDKEPAEVIGIKVIATLFVAVHLVVLLLQDQILLMAAIAATLLYGFSLLIFWSAIYVNWDYPLLYCFTESASHNLVTEGPYRYIRHPFYLSYSLAWIASIVASQELWLLTTAAAMIWIYYQAASREESQWLTSPYADSYRAYMKTTGMFFPSFIFRQAS